jgi:hypothetical protein
MESKQMNTCGVGQVSVAGAYEHGVEIRVKLLAS